MRSDLGTVLAHVVPRDRFLFGPSSLGLFRPALSLPAYAGFVPEDGLSPIYNFFDRTGAPTRWRARVTRNEQRDWRDGRLSYDEHDGTDFVCPPGTPVVAAAPGVLVASRDNWLRGGLTACVDHGGGVVTQYTHLTSLAVPVGSAVRRGDVVAYSGVSGIDLTQFFPFIPPHLHFMVWVDGIPVDPYRRADEAEGRGTWIARNAPRPSPPRADDADPATLDFAVEEGELARVVGTCQDPRIAREIATWSTPEARAAVVEDSLHHDRQAWPRDVLGARVRRPSHGNVRIALPLDPSIYVGATAADMPWTSPRT